MSIKEIKFSLFFVLLFQSCGEIKVKNNEVQNVAKAICTKKNCKKIYEMANDSLKLWVLNKLGMYTFEKGKFEYQLDSLLCLNNNADRLISCILEKIIVNGSDSDGLIFFYGEKINDKWYFFKGASIVVQRAIVKNSEINKPLSYQQLHQIALKEVYSGYLTNNGEINEEWFKSHFENVGWCSTCKTTQDFQKSRLEDVKTLWLQRDTTQPIRQLP